MAHIKLKDMGYGVEKEIGNSKRDLNTLVDDIVYDLVTTNSQLINDVEKKKIPQAVLEQEIVNYIDVNKITLEDESREELIKKVKDYLWGYGVLQEYINREDVSDIKVIDKENTRIKVKGKRMGTDVKFPSDKSLLTFCYYLCIKNGGTLSELNAIQKLSDSTTHPNFLLRINVCINPVNKRSPSIAIRKIPRKKLTLEDLISEDMISLEQYIYLRKAIRSKLNIIWCGKGASGKTTSMNACLDDIPHTNSVLVMQESEELHSAHPDMVFQTVKYKAGESDIEYTLKDLTINGLLMDLDWMVIGEIKGEESMEFFNAIYTGHVGWTSIHASSAMKAPNKAVHLMKYSKTDLKRTELLEMLGELDLIIFMKNFKCMEMVEVSGYDYEKCELDFNPIFKYEVVKEQDGYSEGYFKKLNNSCEKILNKFKIHDFEFEGVEVL